jgi:hypothetical protein
VDVRVADGSTEAATILDLDQTRVNMQPFNRRGLFPGEERTPLIVTREGSGRAAYIAGELGPERNRAKSYELDRLIRNTVVWAGGEPPVSTDNWPPTVHVSLMSGEDKLVAVVTNQTTNPLRHAVIRYVVPVENLKLHIATEGKVVKTVSSATGSITGHSQDGDYAVVHIPRLAVADCVVLHTE